MLKTLAIGKVVRDPYSNDPGSSGKKKFTSVTIVSNDWVGSNPDGTPKYQSTFLSCASFDKTAENMSRLSQGDIIFVSGEPSVESYEKDGKTNTGLKIVVREWSKVSSGVSKETAVAASEDMNEDNEDGDSLFG